MKSLIPFIVLISLLAYVLYPTHAQEANPPEDPSCFANKIAILYMRGLDIKESRMIRNARFKHVQDRWLLFGESPATAKGEDWTTGAEIYVDWNRVDFFFLLTEEQFQDRVLDYEAPVNDKL